MVGPVNYGAIITGKLRELDRSHTQAKSETFERVAKPVTPESKPVTPDSNLDTGTTSWGRAPRP